MIFVIRDRRGFCYKVCTYCSSSVLGICKTKRTAYCCFESKLSRVLQEQGRTQLGKPWDKPKKEQCLGFTIDEFARLRSEEHTSELQSLMRISYAVFCLKKKTTK